MTKASTFYEKLSVLSVRIKRQEISRLINNKKGFLINNKTGLASVPGK